MKLPRRSLSVVLGFLFVFLVVFFSKNLLQSARTIELATPKVEETSHSDSSEKAKRKRERKKRSKDHTKKKKKGPDLMCTWKPGSRTECVNLLVNRIQATTTGQNVKRWILVGDSTMARLFRTYYALSKQLRNKPCPEYPCKLVSAERCNTDQVFGFPRPQTWQPPIPSSEGPVLYGLKNPYCQDCYDCSTHMMIPYPNDTSIALTCNETTAKEVSMGGYISIEFARDVEVQSIFHRTTQENFGRWLNDTWNTPLLVREWGRPVCLVSSGIHDAAIPNITMETYLRNIHDYVRLLVEQCAHVIWLGNTSPATDNYAQKLNQTRDWNLGVMNLLHTQFANQTSFVDVFDASMSSMEHLDNIHMVNPWYELLSQMFAKVAKSLSRQQATP